MNIINGLKPLTIFTKKLHLRCFTRFCVRLCSEVTSSIYQTYKFKFILTHLEGIVMSLTSFWNETLCLLGDVKLSENLGLLCDCMFAVNTKTSFI